MMTANFHAPKTQMEFLYKDRPQAISFIYKFNLCPDDLFQRKVNISTYSKNLLYTVSHCERFHRHYKALNLTYQ